MHVSRKATETPLLDGAVVVCDLEKLTILSIFLTKNHEIRCDFDGFGNFFQKFCSTSPVRMRPRSSCPEINFKSVLLPHWGGPTMTQRLPGVKEVVMLESKSSRFFFLNKFSKGVMKDWKTVSNSRFLRRDSAQTDTCFKFT